MSGYWTRDSSNVEPDIILIGRMASMFEAGHVSIDRVTLSEYELMQAFSNGRHRYETSDSSVARANADKVMPGHQGLRDQFQGTGMNLLEFIEAQYDE